VAVIYQWRGPIVNDELNQLHAEAFDTRLFTSTEWDWGHLLDKHSLGWVIAHDGEHLAGFVNVVWDGLVHAWIQDVMVANAQRGAGVGSRLVEIAAEAARDRGCEWLHVDFDESLTPFYIDACGFTPTSAGILQLR
jgi:GNAT superfamily N-acetyltransferase